MGADASSALASIGATAPFVRWHSVLERPFEFATSHLKSPSMDESRIAELLEPFIGVCDAPALFRCISIYIDMLARWNARVNLTAIRDPEQIVTRHFGESLFAASRIFPHHVGTGCADGQTERSSAALSPSMALADVGSGAGFPGLPIKLWVPKLLVTLVESNHKKAAFLREVVRALILTNINIQIARAEMLPPSSFDVVTLRAVERFETILPAAAALAKPSGRLALLIGASQLDRARALLPRHTSSPALSIPQSTARILLIAQAPGEPN